MTIFERGTALFDRGTKTADGRTVVYRRGQLSASITGTPSFRRDTIENDNGFGLNTTAYDWIFTASELAIRDEIIEPRAGDRITDGVFVYEVLALDDGDPCFEPMDSSGVLLKVHTKRVAS